MEFPHELANRLVRAMVANPQIQTLISMLGEDEDDVVSAGVMYALEQWPKFDPDLAQPQTFIQQRANSGVYNLLRKSGAQDRTEQRSMGLLHKPDKNRDECDWLAETYEAAKRVYTARRFRQGRKFYNIAQLVSLAALMQRKNLTCRGCREYLSDREDLMTVVRLRRLPSKNFFNRAMHALADFGRNQVGTVNAENQSDVGTENLPLKQDVGTENSTPLKLSHRAASAA
jgi:hypothetical protein